MTAKWIPTTDLSELRRLGKLCEEVNELGAIASRCIIQGVYGKDPRTQTCNLKALSDEIADVYVQLHLTVEKFGLDMARIHERFARKEKQMQEWEALFSGE